jgi:hypothetical protein
MRIAGHGRPARRVPIVAPCYVFSSHNERLQSLVLIDSNTDGTLDSWIDVTPDAWCSGDWGSSSNYVFLPRR